MHQFLLWLRSAFVLLVLHALAACGYIGYDLHEAADAGGADAAEIDASTEPSDAGEPSDADEPPDADEPAPMDAGQDADANPGMDAAADAEPSDAAAADAGMDGATLDAGMDSTTLDAGGDASDASQDARQATQVSDYCVQIPALPDEPVIDGVVDGALALLTVVPLDWSNTSVALPTHTTAQYAFAFRPNGLYAFVRVRDPNRLPALTTDPVWRGDSVELYADSDGMYAMQHGYDNPGTVQIVVGAPANDVTPLVRGTRYREAVEVGSWTSARYASYPTVDGYVVEAFLEASALDLASWALTRGGHVGIDVGMNISPSGEADAGVEGQRLGQYFLHVGTGDGCNGRPFCTPAAFCNPTLVD